MTQLFLNGCNGRMGQQISLIVQMMEGLEIVAGSDLDTNSDFGYPVYENPSDCRETFDVLIDFSNPAAIPRLVEFIRARKCPSVICTTGLDEGHKKLLHELSETAPVFISANMSLGINVLVNLARQTAKLLYPEFDIEIIEAHHNQKLDAPSGTAMMLAEEIKDELARPMDFCFDRSQVRQKRGATEIGLHAVRGGNITGDHTVLFAGPEETLELKHHAHSRAVFARGALSAAQFMAGKPAGLYSMKQLVDQFTIKKEQ